MKKKAWRILLTALCAAGFLLCGQKAGAEDRKLTVMVYMCGSNLESEYGSASKDIQEMISSGVSAEHTAVLVMMGGSGSWDLLPDTKETVILEVGSGRKRIVRRSDQLNMGSADTLTDFLRFGRDQYPAENYALIFWDHGGGPLEGVCWDELFSMDNLTLEELTEGLRRTYMQRKLSWIGFDACLMGSAEVAAAVAPYAEYMIASQETEPAQGWNYAFLKDADGNGAETGRRIVDSYFDALSDSRDPLTMACIDLSRVGAVIDGMEEFFPAVDESVSEDHFAELSLIRSASAGFGQGVRAVGEEGYDLVDLSDLTERFGGADSALGKALLDAVVYVRSDDGKAGGLSVYHPYTNKKKYLESWRDDYRRLPFSAAYTRYLEHFGAVLTGEEYVDWSGMVPSDQGSSANGGEIFGLRLTEDQRRHFLAAEMLLMVNFGRSPGEYSLAPISVLPVSSDGAGMLSAEYRGNALYAVDPDGNILTGPVSFMRSADGGYYVILAVYHDYSARADAKNDTAVLHYCRLNEKTGELKIERNYVYDRVSETYTNRIPFSPEGFSDMEFRYFIRNMPYPSKAVPAFEDWDLYGGYMARPLSLPRDWRLKFLDDPERVGRDKYAVFQITDVFQNRWSSLPLKIQNPGETEIPVTQVLTEPEGVEIACSAMVTATESDRSLRIIVRVQNGTDNTLYFHGSGIILNGTRDTASTVYISDVEPGKAGESVSTLRDEQLAGLGRAESADFTLRMSVRGDYEADPVEIPVHLELADVNPEILPPAPEAIAECRDGEAVWQLISLRQGTDGRLTGMLHVLNGGGTELQTSGMLLINGMQTNTSLSVHLAPGTDAYMSFTEYNHASVSSLHVSGASRLYLFGVNQALEQAGVAAADQLDFYPELSYYSQPDPLRRITLRLTEGVALQPAEKLPEPAVLMDCGGIRVVVEQVLIADDGIAVGLRMENDSDETVLLDMVNPSVNGKAYEKFDRLFEAVGVRMPPHSRAVKCLTFQNDADCRPGVSAEEMTFLFRIGNRFSTPVSLRFPAGTVFGAPGGTLLTAEETGVTQVVMDQSPMALNEQIAVSGAEVRPVRVTAPLAPERAEQLDNGNVSLCVLSYEKGKDPGSPELPVTRTISRTGLEYDGAAWTAELSGLAVVVQDHFLDIWEDRTADRVWNLSPDSIFFYTEEGACRPSGDGLFFDALYGDESVYRSRISLTVENRDGRASVAENAVELRSVGYETDKRTNRYLREIAEAAVESRVFHGTNRPEYYSTLDCYETFMLNTEDSVTVSLVPYDAVEGRKCLYYALFFKDGSREDLIVDPDTGETLDRTFTAAE